MEECTDEKYNQRSGSATIAQIYNRNINVSNAPPMYWHIPCSPKSVNAGK